MMGPAPRAKRRGGRNGSGYARPTANIKYLTADNATVSHNDLNDTVLPLW
jgi:hypothetical protein